VVDAQSEHRPSLADLPDAQRGGLPGAHCGARKTPPS
jgi:hypothetical protein